MTIGSLLLGRYNIRISNTLYFHFVGILWEKSWNQLIHGRRKEYSITSSGKKKNYMFKSPKEGKWLVSLIANMIFCSGWKKSSGRYVVMNLGYAVVGSYVGTFSLIIVGSYSQSTQYLGSYLFSRRWKCAYFHLLKNRTTTYIIFPWYLGTYLYYVPIMTGCITNRRTINRLNKYSKFTDPRWIINYRNHLVGFLRVTRPVRFPAGAKKNWRLC